MSTILRIDCSPKRVDGHSWQAADALIRHLTAQRPGVTVVHRDLTATPPPFIDRDFAGAMGSHATSEAARRVPALATSEALLAELETSGILVIATPMHNFTVPAALKAWVDQVARVGRAFRSTREGKVGNLADRPTFLILSSGGFFHGEQARQPDFLTPYLTAILATMGIKSVEIIRLQGLTRGEEALEKARAAATAQIAAIDAAAILR